MSKAFRLVQDLRAEEARRTFEHLLARLHGDELARYVAAFRPSLFASPLASAKRSSSLESQFCKRRPRRRAGSGMVWVNTEMKIFHRERDRWYGNQPGSELTVSSLVQGAPMPHTESTVPERCVSEPRLKKAVS